MELDRRPRVLYVVCLGDLAGRTGARAGHKPTERAAKPGRADGPSPQAGVRGRAGKGLTVCV